MSRHRNVRNYAYEDEMSEDVYGHSVEEYDMCISPSTAQQFMYNRGGDQQQSNLFTNYMSGRFGSVEEEHEEENSEDEDHLSSSQDYRRPQLDPISEAKLSSCLDQLQSVLGDDCHEPTAVDAILKYNFDAEKALDYIFSKDQYTKSLVGTRLYIDDCDETKKGSSQQKTTKKQDSSLHHRLLKKNLAKSVSNHKHTKMIDFQHAKANRQSCSQNNSRILEGSSLLSMPLSSILTDKVKSDAFKNQLSFTSLGSLMTRTQQESSSLASMPKIQSLSHSRDPLLHVSLKTLSEEQPAKRKSHQESTLSSPWDKSNSGNVMGFTSLSSLAVQHGESANTGALGLSGISLQELAKENPSSVAETSHSSETAMDMLGSTSLSSLAEQHGESTLTKPLGLSGISLQELAKENPSSLAETSHSSEAPMNMLGSLSSLAKQHDKPLGISGISLRELAERKPSNSLTIASNEPSDTCMFISTSLSSFARKHDKPLGISGGFLQDLAKELPPSFTNQDKHFPTNSHYPLDQGMSSWGKQPSRDCYRTHRAEQDTRNSAQDSVLATSLSSLASLSLDSNTSRKSRETSQMSYGLSDKKSSTISAPSILSNNYDSRTLDEIITLPTNEKQSTLYLKESKKKKQGLNCEEQLLKVSGKSINKKRKHKISQISALLMKPSMFARTLCLKTKRKFLFPDHLKSKRLCSSGFYGSSGKAVFDFMSPSPDDTIRMKQQQRFGVQHGNQKA